MRLNLLRFRADDPKNWEVKKKNFLPKTGLEPVTLTFGLRLKNLVRRRGTKILKERTLKEKGTKQVDTEDVFVALVLGFRERMVRLGSMIGTFYFSRFGEFLFE